MGRPIWRDLRGVLDVAVGGGQAEVGQSFLLDPIEFCKVDDLGDPRQVQRNLRSFLLPTEFTCALRAQSYSRSSDSVMGRNPKTSPWYSTPQGARRRRGIQLTLPPETVASLDELARVYGSRSAAVEALVAEKMKSTK